VLKLKLGAMFGFALGWLVGSGRAAELWDQFQGNSGRKPVPTPTTPLDRTA
jgi:hypothetical protein